MQSYSASVKQGGCIACSSRKLPVQLLKLSFTLRSLSHQQAKQEEVQRKAAEEKKRREEALRRKEDDAANRRCLFLSLPS